MNVTTTPVRPLRAEGWGTAARRMVRRGGAVDTHPMANATHSPTDDTASRTPTDTPTDTSADTSSDTVAGPPTTRAWTEDDVCAYLGIGRRRLREVIGDDPTFPRPRCLGSRLGRRWAPDAVPAWVAAPSTDDDHTARRPARRGSGQRIR